MNIIGSSSEKREAESRKVKGLNLDLGLHSELFRRREKRRSCNLRREIRWLQKVS